MSTSRRWSRPTQDPLSHLEQREAAGKRAGGFGLLLTGKLVDELLFQRARQRGDSRQAPRLRMRDRGSGRALPHSGAAALPPSSRSDIEQIGLLAQLTTEPRVALAPRLEVFGHRGHHLRRFASSARAPRRGGRNRRRAWRTTAGCGARASGPRRSRPAAGTARLPSPSSRDRRRAVVEDVLIEDASQGRRSRHVGGGARGHLRVVRQHAGVVEQLLAIDGAISSRPVGGRRRTRAFADGRWPAGLAVVHVVLRAARRLRPDRLTAAEQGCTCQRVKFDKLTMTEPATRNCRAVSGIRSAYAGIRAARGQCPGRAWPLDGSRPAMAATAAQTSGNTPGFAPTGSTAALPREWPGSGALARGCPPARSAGPLRPHPASARDSRTGHRKRRARPPGCVRPGAPSPDRDRAKGQPSSLTLGQTLAVQRIAAIHQPAQAIQPGRACFGDRFEHLLSWSHSTGTRAPPGPGRPSSRRSDRSCPSARRRDGRGRRRPLPRSLARDIRFEAA